MLPSASAAQEADVRLFEPVAGGGLLGVHEARTLEHLEWRAAVTTGYANDVLVAKRANGEVFRPLSDRLLVEPSAAIGLLGWGHLGVSVPIYAWQAGDGAPAPDVNGSGLGDIRITPRTKVRIAELIPGLAFAFIPEVTLPTGDGSRLMGSPSVGFVPRAAAELGLPGGAHVAFNLGWRWRSVDRLLDLDVGQEVLVGAAGELPLRFRGVSALASVLGAFGVEGDPAASSKWRTGPMEALGGLRWRHPLGVTVTLGMGAGLTAGYGAPDQRILLSAVWMPDDVPAWVADTEEKTVLVASAAMAVGTTDEPSPDTPGAALTEPPATEPSAGPAADVPPPARRRKLDPAAFDAAAAADTDPDNDGLAGPADKCPRKAEDADGFEDGDGCPDSDNDKDGVPDAADSCPLEAEVINGVEDDDGCPDEGKAAVAVVKGKVVISESVFFATGSDRVKKRSHAILSQVARLLRARWDVRLVRVEGHTDNVGDPEANVDLSERRARQVRKFLVSKGVASHRLAARGFGPSKPVAKNKTRKGRAANRRVDFAIVKQVDAEEGR